MTREDLVELTGEEILMFADGLDEAIIGYAQTFTGTTVLYDQEKVIKILRGQGMSEEDAWDFFDFNVLGAYMGEGTPTYAILVKEKVQ